MWFLYVLPLSTDSTVTQPPEMDRKLPPVVNRWDRWGTVKVRQSDMMVEPLRPTASASRVNRTFRTDGG